MATTFAANLAEAVLLALARSSRAIVSPTDLANYRSGELQLDISPPSSVRKEKLHAAALAAVPSLWPCVLSRLPQHPRAAVPAEDVEDGRALPSVRPRSRSERSEYSHVHAVQGVQKDTGTLLAKKQHQPLTHRRPLAPQRLRVAKASHRALQLDWAAARYIRFGLHRPHAQDRARSAADARAASADE